MNLRKDHYQFVLKNTKKLYARMVQARQRGRVSLSGCLGDGVPGPAGRPVRGTVPQRGHGVARPEKLENLFCQGV